jgi:hypothetical protein
MHSMSAKYLFFAAMVVVCLLATGCTSPAPATPAATPTPEVILTTPPVTVSSTPPWVCYGNAKGISLSGPRTRFVYEQSDPNTPHSQGLPAPDPTPAYTGNTLQGDPILGTYIFDPGQFKATEVERMEFYSSLSSPDFYYVVPLDISPDIQWTFRDDGVLLFYQNTINSSDTSLRRFWRTSNGEYLRSGTWKVLNAEKDKTRYQVTWGCSPQSIHTYVVTYDANGVSLTQPNVLKMIKVG